MKSLLSIAVVAALAGVGLGAVWAYVEVPPVLENPLQTASNAANIGDSSALTLPQAEVPETVFDFDKMERGTTMSHAFKVRNVGGGPLHLEVTSTTCKCTVGDLDANEIAPNEETEVKLEWVAKTSAGPFRHGAVLKTNDPLHSSIELTVEGQVVESTSVIPGELFFGTVTSGDTATADVYLMTFVDEQSPEVTNYELGDPQLAEQIDVTISPAEQAVLPDPAAVAGLKVSVTYRSGKSIGPFRDWLTMHTNLKKAETITVPIVGTVVGDVTVFGAGWDAQKGLLKMGSFSSVEGRALPLKLAIRGEHAKDIQFEVAEVDPPELQVTLGEPRQMGEKLLHVPLTIAVSPGSKPMVRAGEPISSDALVVLQSSVESIPEVRLRVHFTAE